MVYIRKFLQRFYKKQDGAVAIIVAVALVAILFGILSLSIDMNRAQTSYTHNYNATDASALAGAEMWLQAKIDAIGKIPDPLDFRPTDDEMTEYAKKVLIENFAQDQDSSSFLDNNTFVVTMDESRLANGKIRYKVKVEACAQLATPVSNVPKHVQDAENPGIAKTCTSSTAGFDLGKLENAEVAFALDFTDSMYWKGANQSCLPSAGNGACPTFTQTKAYALQQAMDYVFTEYFDASKDSTAYASIVPYTGFVNIWPYADNGVVFQGTEKIDYDGKAFGAGGPNEAATMFRAMGMKKTIGDDLQTYVYDPDYRTSSGGTGSFYPFYTYSPYDGSTIFETQNYNSILNRIPTVRNADMLQSVINNPDNHSFLPFDNYYDLIKVISKENFVWDPTISSVTNWGTTDPNEQYAKMICYQYTVAAAADERIDGALISSDYIKGYTGSAGNKNIELHEAFPIQPLTNDSNVLNTVLKRYISDTKLTSNYNGRTDIVDFQSTRVDKARVISMYHKTSSIHGLMWAWFTINNAWQDIWEDEDSLHETYVGGSKSVRDGSAGEKLPSEKNFKHIILISDGFDNDGCNDLTGGTTSSTTNSQLGRRNVCDAYTPVEAVTDDQYNDLCTAIKTNGTSDINDDITVHTITLDFDANVSSSKPECQKASGDDNRLARCATPGEYYNNVTPDELEKMFDDIFAGILTKAVPVRLIE